MFLDRKASRARVQRAVNECLRENGLEAELIFTSVEERGASADFSRLRNPGAKAHRTTGARR